MGRARLESLLNDFREISILVVGDFFLDKYLIIEPRLAERSLETGLVAHQVIARRLSPGAGGTVTTNLRSLGVGRVVALSVIGDDGEGYDLKKGLDATGVDTSSLIVSPDRMTPTYTKPMMRGRYGCESEMDRQDIKNRSPLAGRVERSVIEALHALVPRVDGVIVADQVQEEECGTITTRVREAICRLAKRRRQTIFFADSRCRIGRFRHVHTKPNMLEAVLAVRPRWTGRVGVEFAEECGRALARRTERIVFVTLGPRGMSVCRDDGSCRVPTVEPKGPIDPVGAGDSATAGIVPTLCCGASPQEAALVGNLAAAATIVQIGTTGAASPAQVMAAFRRLPRQSMV